MPTKGGGLRCVAAMWGCGSRVLSPSSHPEVFNKENRRISQTATKPFGRCVYAKPFSGKCYFRFIKVGYEHTAQNASCVLRDSSSRSVALLRMTHCWVVDPPASNLDLSLCSRLLLRESFGLAFSKASGAWGRAPYTSVFFLIAFSFAHLSSKEKAGNEF